MPKDFFLLGAGASREAKVPVSREMCQDLLKKLQREHIDPGCYRALSFVLGGLVFHQSAHGGSPFDGVNVEDAFNAIEVLSHRDYLEFAPFVSQWHSAIEVIEKPSESLQKEKVEKFYQALLPYLKTSKTFWSQGVPDGGQIKENLMDAISYMSGNPERGEIFSRTLQEMTRGLIDITWLPPTDKDRVKYLGPLVKYSFENQAPIATLNYDNCIELACVNIGVPITSGIENWSANQGFTLGDPSRNLFLLKLHGSIDWEKVITAPHSSKQPYPQFEVKKREWQPEIAGRYFDPAVIFGHRNKLTMTGPFLTLLSAFRDLLEQAERLTVIGYSFSDSHINEVIGQWLNRYPNRTLKLMIGSFDISKSEFAKNIPDNQFLLERVVNTGMLANEETLLSTFGQVQ